MHKRGITCRYGPLVPASVAQRARAVGAAVQ